jgi:hypothetical protein
MNFFHYPLKFSAEKTPCVALNDKCFILSSSRVQCEGIAAQLLQKPDELEPSEASWKINAQLLRDIKQRLLAAQTPITGNTIWNLLSYLHSITSRSKTSAGTHVTETLIKWKRDQQAGSLGMN